MWGFYRLEPRFVFGITSANEGGTPTQREYKQFHAEVSNGLVLGQHNIELNLLTAIDFGDPNLNYVSFSYYYDFKETGFDFGIKSFMQILNHKDDEVGTNEKYLQNGVMLLMIL